MRRRFVEDAGLDAMKHAREVIAGALLAIALGLIGAAFLAEWSTVASDWMTLAEWVKP